METVTLRNSDGITSSVPPREVCLTTRLPRNNNTFGRFHSLNCAFSRRSRNSGPETGSHRSEFLEAGTVSVSVHARSLNSTPSCLAGTSRGKFRDSGRTHPATHGSPMRSAGRWHSTGAWTSTGTGCIGGYNQRWGLRKPRACACSKSDADAAAKPNVSRVPELVTLRLTSQTRQ